MSLCVYFETDAADVSEDVKSEEAEDSDFWEGVTKPGSSKTASSPSQQENQVKKCVFTCQCLPSSDNVSLKSFDCLF